MTESTDKKQPGATVQGKTAAVVGNVKTGKYAIVILIAIIVAIIGQSFFKHAPNENQTVNKTALQPADTATVQLNLGNSAAQEAANLPVLPPPKIHVPSILPPPDFADMEQNAQANATRLKSPSLVYSADNNAPTNNLEQSQTSGASNPNSAFAQQASNAPVVTVSAKQDTDMDYKILQGKLIPAVLETAIDSDLPGMVRAVVSEDVYGDTGNVILLPKGTRLIGQYNSSLLVGQTRVMVVWTRAITPQHIDIALGSPNTDQLGEAGTGGIVDSHFWQIFGTSALLSVLGVAASSANVGGSSSSNLGVYGNPYQAAVAQGVTNTSNTVLQGRINIQPTIRVPQGSVIQVFVARDLDFSKLSSYQNDTGLVH